MKNLIDIDFSLCSICIVQGYWNFSVGYIAINDFNGSIIHIEYDSESEYNSGHWKFDFCYIGGLYSILKQNKGKNQ